MNPLIFFVFHFLFFFLFLSSGMTLELERGQITLTPYHVIEQFLLRDEVDLV
jgi:hypothetical protein